MKIQAYNYTLSSHLCTSKNGLLHLHCVFLLLFSSSDWCIINNLNTKNKNIKYQVQTFNIIEVIIEVKSVPDTFFARTSAKGGRLIIFDSLTKYLQCFTFLLLLILLRTSFGYVNTI